MTNEEFLEKYNIGLDISVDKDYVHIYVNEDDGEFIINPQIGTYPRENQSIREIINNTLGEDCWLEIRKPPIDKEEWKFLKYLINTRRTPVESIMRKDYRNSCALYFYCKDDSSSNRMDFKGRGHFEWLLSGYSYYASEDGNSLNCPLLAIKIRDGEYIE